MLSIVRKHRAPKGALRRQTAWSSTMVCTRCQKAPSAKRCIKTDRRLGVNGTCRWWVRKHRAPKGALRQIRADESLLRQWPGQKAPSAKRCIKTCIQSGETVTQALVRKHRAPKGALRHLDALHLVLFDIQVRKHRAPKGALRRVMIVGFREYDGKRQKAPSAKRCIKTQPEREPMPAPVIGQKAPSAKRCIKTPTQPTPTSHAPPTCQKAPSAKRCIKTFQGVFVTERIL